MSLLDQHIRRAVLLSMAIVVALLASLDLLFSLIDQLADTDENYSALQALQFVLMTAPSSIYELLPFAALGGALIGLGVLASQNELVVMQAAGVRVSRIVLSVLKPTLAVMLLGLLLGEYVAPPLEQFAQSQRAIQRSGSGAINSEEGTWRKIGDDYIHINAIAPGGREIFGVTRYRLGSEATGAGSGTSRELASTSYAESARYIEAPGAVAYWQLENVQQTLFQGDRIATNSYLQEDWQVELSPQLLSVLLVEPDEQPLSGLFRLARFFDGEGLDSASYYLAFWKKLLQPLTTLALVMLAVSFVFGPLRESTTGFRVFVALGIGLLFTIFQRLMEPASLLLGFDPLLAVLTPIVLFGSCGFWLLRGVR